LQRFIEGAISQFKSSVISGNFSFRAVPKRCFQKDLPAAEV